MSTRIISWW